ncbi:hypothetical protein LL14B4_12605 [Lactococcus lactis subsp. lactis]|uniref:Gp28/Gp37-like domain-containing protein n=1 Tax=Lactococcus lactis subsp. lactis TaxID=1360 RepID=A0A2Z3KHG5_LACLL|nr:siphovirus ReqiPepy6 Gp37-like family protein [Lactococcus lactis]AWN66947.1 hypothetical protein LL14B4_12605 [Lactococcus lactis subsp. lactis]
MQNDLSIEIFERQSGFKYLSRGILDTFKSCIVVWNAYSFNTFQLTMPLIPTYLPYFIEENILSIKDCYFYIDVVKFDSSQSNLITITGKSLLGKAKDRIIKSTYSVLNKKPEQIIYDLINNHVVTGAGASRSFNFLSIQQPDDLQTTALNYQNSYGKVSEEISSLADSNQICIRELATNLENPAAQIQLYKGRDLSGDGGIEFSLSDEGLKTENIVRDNSDLSTTAYVFGEGEGTARKNVLIGDGFTGIERRELYVDARDLQQSSTNGNGATVNLSDADYKAQLTQRGQQSLAERVEVIQLSGEINFNNLNFQYGKDYEVGDTVRVTSQRFGITKSSVLTSMQETWDAEGGYHLDPTFDKDRVSLIKKLTRK